MTVLSRALVADWLQKGASTTCRLKWPVVVVDETDDAFDSIDSMDPFVSFVSFMLRWG